MGRSARLTTSTRDKSDGRSTAISSADSAPDACILFSETGGGGSCSTAVLVGASRTPQPVVAHQASRFLRQDKGLWSGPDQHKREKRPLASALNHPPPQQCQESPTYAYKTRACSELLSLHLLTDEQLPARQRKPDRTNRSRSRRTAASRGDPAPPGSSRIPPASPVFVEVLHSSCRGFSRLVPYGGIQRPRLVPR